jgi:hypothetical protein
LGSRCFGIVLGKRRGDEGRDDAPAALAGMGQRIAHEVDAAALPADVEHLEAMRELYQQMTSLGKLRLVVCGICGELPAMDKAGPNITGHIHIHCSDGSRQGWPSPAFLASNPGPRYAESFRRLRNGGDEAARMAVIGRKPDETALPPRRCAGQRRVSITITPLGSWPRRAVTWRREKVGEWNRSACKPRIEVA